MSDNLPNIAPVDSNGKDTNAPVDNNIGDGGTTNPSLSGGLIANTSISVSNSKLAHQCDFSADIQKNLELKKFLNSQANNIREATRAVMRALGFSDATGQYQWLVDDLKSLTREIKRLQREVVQPIIDFEKLVVEYIKKLLSIINYILHSNLMQSFWDKI